jgi:endonuclease/exonuclease/phosphatase (EEP) superfamily protein YafD
VCEVTHGDQILTIANHHGYHTTTREDTTDTIASMHNVAGRLKEVKTPMVLCGDMNAVPASRTLAQLEPLGLRNLSVEHHLTHTLSSVHRIKADAVSDYVFVSPSLKVSEFHAADEIISDHKALVLTLG